MIRVLLEKSGHLEFVKLHFFSVASIPDESNDNVWKVIPFTTISFLLTGLFVMSSLLMVDGVRSKPWLGVASATAVGLGILASVGLLLGATRLPFSILNMGIPFIMFGKKYTMLWVNFCIDRL